MDARYIRAIEWQLDHSIERFAAYDAMLVAQPTPGGRAAARAMRAVYRRDIEKFSKKLARAKKEMN